MEADKRKKRLSGAMAFVLLMSVVSLFSDMTHEGASSIMGAYLAMAGASAAAIGFVSGLGEFIGYALRLVTGIIADKTRRYWPMTIIGYIIDCFAIPLLALVPQGGWVWACLIIVIQRTGKAIKKPAKDTMTSFAASQLGAGKGFAIQEMLDQIGAFLGPVMLFLVMLIKRGNDTYEAYRLCLALLGIPALITVALVLFSRKKFPHPENFEPEEKTEEKLKLSKKFILYIAAISFVALGFVDFSLITMHVTRNSLISAENLPLLYAAAMLIDAAAAFVFGWVYDKRGMKVLVAAAVLTAGFSIPIFLFNTVGATVAGVLLWGVGMGAQESILKSVITTIVPKSARAAGFGVFQTAFGAAWFAGSWVLGLLYDKSLLAFVIFSVAAQLVAAVLFALSAKAKDA